jgi:PAS domain S-box-containing protein
MNYLLLVIMTLSATFQFIAAFLAIRLIRVSGAHVAWVLLAGGFLVQGIRRAVTLFQTLNGLSQGNMTVEILGLLISLLIVCGVWMIGPLFTRIKQSKQELIEREDELAKSHQELIESETRYRTVADFASDCEFWIAPDNSLRYISPSCVQFCGYTPDEFYRDPQLISKIIYPEDLARYDGHTHILLENGQPQPIDFRITTRDGQERWISHVCRPVVDRDGSSLGWRASNRDITERKHMERVLHEHATMLEAEVAERQRAQETLAIKKLQLETLNHTLKQRIGHAVAELRNKDQLMIRQSRHAAMGEMINFIAHQWRNPLNNLGLVIQGVRHEYDAGQMTPEQMSLYMEKGMKLISFMSQTIDDFRYFFREDKVKKLFSVRESITRAISLVEASLKDNNIRIVVEPGDDLQIEGYSNEYAQALLNLLGNARDALLERAVAAPVIRVKLFREEGRAVVTVSDNAGGIPDDVIDRIFDPYFTTKEESKGTGIGLFMAKTIIEKNMEGRLSVRNVEGGAEFRVEVSGESLTAAKSRGRKPG